MSTGCSWEGIRQVRVTLLGARHVPERLCGGLCLLGALYQVLDLYLFYIRCCLSHCQVMLANGCDVIVTTPDCLLRMMDSRATNLFRLCHLVRDHSVAVEWLDRLNPSRPNKAVLSVVRLYVRTSIHTSGLSSTKSSSNFNGIW